MSPFKSDLETAMTRAESAEQEKRELEKKVAELENPTPINKTKFNVFEALLMFIIFVLIIAFSIALYYRYGH